MCSTICHPLHWIISVRPAFMWTWKAWKPCVFAKMVELSEQSMISFQLVKGMEMEVCCFSFKFFVYQQSACFHFFCKQRFPPKTHRLWHTNARTSASNNLMYWKIWCGCTWSVQILRGHIFPKARLNTCTSETCARFNSLNAMQWYGKLKTVFQ